MTTEQHNKQRVDELIRLLQDEATDPETREMIRAWFWSEVNADAKEVAVIESIGQLTPNMNPDAFELRKYDEQAAQLGFEVAPYKKPIVSLRRKRYYLKRIAISVASAAAVVFVAFLLFNQPDSLQRTKYAKVEVVTPLDGDIQHIVLPDSTTITAGKGSRIHYAENFAESREVYLEGEAFFSVTHQQGREFKVVSNSITVTVYGTEFEVKAYKDEPTAEVKLAEGSVAVTAEGIAETMMTPGQHLVYNKTHKEITLDEIGEGELLRLRGLNFSIKGHTLDESFRMMSQYFGVQFRIDPTLDLSERGAADFEDDASLEDAMSLIRLIATTPFDYTIAADTVTITKRK